VRRLGLDSRRDAYLRVPEKLRSGRRLPLVVMLHGAGGSGRGALSLVQGGGFEEALVLAPESRGRTWDALVAALGPDVAFIDDALEHVFARYPVDPERIVIAGFSDGASYALTLGIANGTLFRRIVAFSPGFASPPSTEGMARIWISHGTEDPVLPVRSCSRRIVPRLRSAGFDVTYREFPGEHEMPDPIVYEAWSWVRQR
jgi:phospholipase/carboxylesterase